MSDLPLVDLRMLFGDRLQENVPLSGYTTSHVGGPARAFLTVDSADQLASAVQHVWEYNIPYLILGNGSNLLVSDSGLDRLVILNRAKAVVVDEDSVEPSVWAESGANLGTVARQAMLHNLAGLEWASTIPGSLGGAVYGNAGAYGSDISQVLVLAEILHRKYGRVTWTCSEMQYAYRSSILKRETGGQAVILAARLKTSRGEKPQIQALMSELSEKRRRSQPPGASMGSTFKNPEGDYAGRLIEAAGLKGTRIGGAEISPIHGNFIINDGTASAADYFRIIKLVQKTVREKFGVDLQLEVECLGDWQGVE